MQIRIILRSILRGRFRLSCGHWFYCKGHPGRLLSNVNIIHTSDM